LPLAKVFHSSSLRPTAKRQKPTFSCKWCGDEDSKNDQDLKQHIDEIHRVFGDPAPCRPRTRRARLTPSPTLSDLGEPGEPSSSGENKDGAPKFIKVSGLDHAGLAEVEHGIKMLFVRQEVEKMWAFLGRFLRRKMLQGPPGTGKSSATWAWARKAAAGKCVLWVHLRKRHAPFVAVLQINNVTVVGAVITTVLIALVSRSTADIIVLDGVVSATSSDLLEAADAWAAKKHPRCVVQVTSESVTETGETLKETNTEEHMVPSWTFKQYEIAMTDDAFG
jgi:hypothetical protein